MGPAGLSLLAEVEKPLKGRLQQSGQVSVDKYLNALKELKQSKKRKKT
jgi:hypothetical protein